VYVVAWLLFLGLAYVLSQQDLAPKALWDPYEIIGVPEVCAHRERDRERESEGGTDTRTPQACLCVSAADCVCLCVYVCICMREAHALALTVRVTPTRLRDPGRRCRRYQASVPRAQP
jgi:hypothetical protein